MVQTALSGLHAARPHCNTVARLLLPGAAPGGSNQVRLVTQQPKAGSAGALGEKGRKKETALSHLSWKPGAWRSQ